MASGRTFPVKTSRIRLPEPPTPNQSLTLSNLRKGENAEHKYTFSNHDQQSILSRFWIKWVESNSSTQQLIKAATRSRRHTAQTCGRDRHRSNRRHEPPHLQTRSLAAEVKTFMSYAAAQSGWQRSLPAGVSAHWCASRSVNSHLHLPV